jgi:hypothetical protein
MMWEVSDFGHNVLDASAALPLSAATLLSSLSVVATPWGVVGRPQQFLMSVSLA